MSFVLLLVSAIVIALLLYALYRVMNLFPMPAEVRTIIWVIVIVVMALWLAWYSGVIDKLAMLRVGLA